VKNCIRSLLLLLLLLPLAAAAQSSLPPCPTVTNVRWHNCFGTYTFASRNKYVGEFKDGDFNGKGTFLFLAYGQFWGDKYVGEVKDNKYNGEGTYYSANGDKYVGEFKDGKRNGQGVFVHADGTTAREGIWVDDQFVRAERINPRILRRLAIEVEQQRLDDELRRQERERSRFAASLSSASLGRLPWKERLDRVIESELRQWLNVDTIGLDEVPAPVYPAALSLNQEAWETNKEFEARVEAARNERRRAIERLEADYRGKVEQRNKRVAEYNKTRQERQAGLVKRRQELIVAGLVILAPAVKLSDVALDQQLGVLTVSAEIDGLGRQVFAFKDAPQAFRRSALTEAGAMKATPDC
jgi:hypothetical protein